jgi:hypothetical protein
MGRNTEKSLMKKIKSFIGWSLLFIIEVTAVIYILKITIPDLEGTWGFFEDPPPKVIYSTEPVDIISFAPLSVQVYHHFTAWADSFNVPTKIVKGILREETNFRTPLNFGYNPYQISYADAYGPAQVQLETARWVANDETITKHDVLYNIKFNAYLSMKYIRHLKDRYGSWLTACGYYNTGYPVVNQYARNIVI